MSHLSYSQVNGFLHCGHQYYLERVRQVPARPSWAAVGGKAVHAMTEAHDLISLGQGDELVTLTFEEALEDSIAEESLRSGYAEEDFRASGRASKAYPNKEDKSWWLEHGPQMVERWATWRQVSPWEIWMDGETPAIELEVNAEFGGVPVKAYIDRIMVHTGTGELAVVDIKSGTLPAGAMQLGQYSAAVLRCHIVPSKPQYGFFWDARSGSTSQVYDLDVWTPEFFDYAFKGVAERRTKQDLYLPKITNMCVSCGVRDFCRYIGGERAGEVPAPWEQGGTQ